MMFLADSGEPKVVQAVEVGSVSLVLIVLLVLIRFLDHPFQDGPRGLQPTAMQRTLSVLEHELAGVGEGNAAPTCNSVGVAR